MVLLNVLAELLGFFRMLNRIVFLLIIGLGLALHTKEDHLFLTHLLNGLASKDTTNEALRDLSSMLFVFLLGWSQHFAIMHALADIIRLHCTRDLLQSV